MLRRPGTVLRPLEVVFGRSWESPVLIKIDVDAMKKKHLKILFKAALGGAPFPKTFLSALGAGPPPSEIKFFLFLAF